MMSRLMMSCLLWGIFFSAIGQQKNSQISGGDSVNSKYIARGVRSFSEIIGPGATIKKGLFSIYRSDDQCRIAIPLKLLGKDILVVTRVLKGPAETPVYAGDELNNIVVCFDKGPSNNVFLRKRIFATYSDSANSMFLSINESNYMPIIGSFNIDAYTLDSSALIINFTNFIGEENELFSLGKIPKADNHLTTVVKDKSYISKCEVFPLNMEISSVKTYNQSISGNLSNGISTNSAEFLSCEINTSFILLPEQPMQQRISDDRVGYFSFKQKEYDNNENGVRLRSYIKRWRLEPKPEELEQYKAGRLVEPNKQIVFYIDPATPKQWIPYLKQGVNDWQVAFEAAGFKNAIIARESPSKEEDSTWNLYDARHSAIIYKASEIENASGPSIADPRTGEILESHINWYHNVIQLIRDWYIVQCSLNDTAAQKMVFSNELMGQLIRGVVSHEVGHTLGLTHNFIASYNIPVEKLRDKEWVEKYGFSNSVMDYARFNYVAQPEDGISRVGLLPRIGDYDKWAIEWGYRRFYQNYPAAEQAAKLDNWVIEKTKNPRLLFGSEHNWGDPRIQREDLGNDAMLASSYGIKNLKQLIPNLIKWTKMPHEGYENLNQVYNALKRQYQTYLIHVAHNIGGIYETIKNAEQNGPIYEPVPVSKQQRAVEFLNNYLFITPLWLLDDQILNRTGQTSLGVMGQIHDDVFRTLFFLPNLQAMIARNEASCNKRKSYSLIQLLDDLKKSIWSELYEHNSISLIRRSLQRYYVKNLLDLLKQGGLNTQALLILPVSGVTSMYGQDAYAFVAGHLIEIKKDIKDNLTFIKDRETRYHLMYLSDRIEQTFEFLRHNRVY